jgi:type VI protein secretion system component Hcp
MAIFMTFVGAGAPPGLTLEAGYEQAVRVDSVSWSVARSLATYKRSAGREAASPVPKSVVVRRRVDLFSEILIGAGARQAKAYNVLFEFTRTEESTGSHRTYHSFTFEGARVDNYMAVATTATAPEETFSLEFERMTVRHVVRDNSGREVPGGRFAHDFTAGKR